MGLEWGLYLVFFMYVGPSWVRFLWYGESSFSEGSVEGMALRYVFTSFLVTIHTLARSCQIITV